LPLRPWVGASLHVLAVAQQMALVNRRQPVDLVLLGGENVYPNGDLAQLDRLFVKPYQELLANKVPFLRCSAITTSAPAMARARWPIRLLALGGRWYNLRRRPVEFFMLDHQRQWGLAAPI
jgi:hypothetical protein